MDKQIIAKINDVHIFAEYTESGETLVPIKPICAAIGIEFAAQYVKIQKDEILSSVISLSETTGSDNKQYEMVYLPLRKPNPINTHQTHFNL